MAANAVTDSNSNPIGIPASTTVTVSTVTLSVAGRASQKVFLIGHFSSDLTGATGGIVVAGVTEDGNLMMDTQVNNQMGDSGTLLSLSGVLIVKPGKHVFELTAFAENATYVSAHHRSLTAIELS
jgi:hypothetical protein